MNYRKILLAATAAAGLGIDAQSKTDELREADEACTVAYVAKAAEPSKSDQRGDASPMVPVVGATDSVTEQPGVMYSYDDISETVMRFDGRSWTITRKDIRTGEIERFRQSGTSALGQLEVIQGKPVTGTTDALHRQTFSWDGVEDTASAKLASHKPTPLPKSMRDPVASLILSMPMASGDAINNLLPDDVRREMMAENHALAAHLNAEAKAVRAKAAKPTPTA